MKSPKKSKSKRNSILVLECDANRLATQNLLFGDDVILEPLREQISQVKATTTQYLLSELAKHKEDFGFLDIVVIVGHSNKSGLRLTSDSGLIPWKLVAEWVSPFKPRYAILVACEGSRWLPCADLFEGTPSLKEIYGSPVKLTKQQVVILKLLLLYLGFNHKVSPQLVPIGQLIGFTLTGGLIFRQTKKDFQQTSQSEGMIWMGIEELIKELLKRRM